MTRRCTRTEARRCRYALWLAGLVVLLLGARPAAARPQPGEGEAVAEAAEQADVSSAEDPARLEMAKELFREGNRLRRAGKFERALEHYTKSRALVESTPNTLNAAACLASLKRFDEALELYERVMERFEAELTPAERAAISRQKSRLVRKVGSLQVVASVPGSLVVDGRARGDLPLPSPIRLLPGSHTVVVVKEGYISFETIADVTLGKTTTLRAQLKPLLIAGSLRIDESDLEGADVYVDGALIGQVPWEGILEPGRHVYRVVQGERGSGPQEITIVKGQVALVRVKASPLGQETRVLVRPPEGELLIDGVVVGTGQWRGRLPIGSHELVARDEGYVDQSRQLEIREGRMVNVELELEADLDHPRWGGGEPGLFVFDVFGGFAVSSTLDSAAEESCDSQGCLSDAAPMGFLVGGRAGYEFPFGMSLQATGGYFRLTKELHRVRESSFDAQGTVAPTSYDLTDQLELSGPFVGATLGYRHEIADPVELRANLSAGAVFTTASDTISGTGSANDRTIAVAVGHSGETVSGVDVFVMPELNLGLRFGGFGVSLGLAAAILMLEGPALPNGELAVRGECDQSEPTAIDCAPGNGLVAKERAYGPFVLWLPNLGLSYLF